MKPPNIVTVHFLSTKWSKKLFTINHYELQNGKCIVTQELSAYFDYAKKGNIEGLRRNVLLKFGYNKKTKSRSFANQIACKCRIFNVFYSSSTPKICLGEIFSEVHIILFLFVLAVQALADIVLVLLS